MIVSSQDEDEEEDKDESEDEDENRLVLDMQRDLIHYFDVLLIWLAFISAKVEMRKRSTIRNRRASITQAAT